MSTCMAKGFEPMRVTSRCLDGSMGLFGLDRMTGDATERVITFIDQVRKLKPTAKVTDEHGDVIFVQGKRETSTGRGSHIDIFTIG